MWRRKRTGVPGVPDAVGVSAELLEAASAAPAPLSDAALVAQLNRQLEAKERTIANLTRRLNEPVASDPQCPGCAGLRKVIADLEAGRAEDRQAIARLQLTARAPRERVVPYTQPPEH